MLLLQFLFITDVGNFIKLSQISNPVSSRFFLRFTYQNFGLWYINYPLTIKVCNLCRYPTTLVWQVINLQTSWPLTLNYFYTFLHKNYFFYYLFTISLYEISGNLNRFSCHPIILPGIQIFRQTSIGSGISSYLPKYLIFAHSRLHLGHSLLTSHTFLLFLNSSLLYTLYFEELVCNLHHLLSSFLLLKIYCFPIYNIWLFFSRCSTSLIL